MNALQPNPIATAGAASAAAQPSEQVSLPSDVIALLPLPQMVMFPGLVLPVGLPDAAAIAAAQYAVKNERPLGLVTIKSDTQPPVDPGQMYRIGTVAQVLRYVTAPDGDHIVICQGQERLRIVEFVDGYPFAAARIERLPDDTTHTREIDARMLQLKTRAAEALQLLPKTPTELVRAVESVQAPGALADLVASFMDIGIADKQAILELLPVDTRLDRVLWLLAQRIEVLRLSRDINERVSASMDKRQREYVLREQIKTIQQELGEDGDASTELAELRAKLEAAGMPEDVRTQANRELKRLERMPDVSAEYSMVRTYLEWLAELPWATDSGAEIDIARARLVLDEDHHGLEKIKRRILEYLAVKKLNPGSKSPILCFVGPPGVGKTSLGQSIARALGRKFVRVSLGGVHDEAEIRGHRRTYVGALPGNVIQGIRKAGTRDCVMMFDEVDKLGQGFHGDPSAALLEVLDPEQNHTFRDTYLGVPFDLSKVVFISTANMLDTIPGPLRDRMEVIHLPGYTEDEKLQIANRYLVKRQFEANGLTPEQVQLDQDVLPAVIRDYTREAGVRNLEREVGAVMRRAAVRIAEGTPAPIRIGAADLAEILGPPRFEDEPMRRVSLPGVATGLAWTPVGGDILYIEASRTRGSARLILTGQLGDVMKESAQAALTLVKSRADALGLSSAEQLDALDKSDIHIHVPAGAIPKDGPSAGVAMFLALASLLSNRPIRHDVAMTGEISLRGLVLPVGGIKEKVLAALRSGITTVILPARNKKDLNDIPQSARDRLRFIWLDDVDQALREALGAIQPSADARASQAQEPEPALV